MPPSRESLSQSIQQCRALLQLVSEKLETLSAELTALPPAAEGHPKSDLLPSGNSEGNKEAQIFQSENPEGNKDIQIFLSEKSEGNHFHSKFHSEFSERNKLPSSIPSENPEGSKNDFSSGLQLSEGNKQRLSALNLADLPPAQRIYQVLHAGEMLGSKRVTIRNVAATLLRFAPEGGGQSQAHLAAWLKMSKGGIAKYMMMLHRRGLIRRKAFQTYALTEKAWAILEEARARTLS